MKPASALRAVVVLYHPDDSAIAMIDAIETAGYRPVVVVNAIDPSRLGRLRAMQADVMVNFENIGLAAAFNQGIECAIASGASYVMLLDQDTRPSPDMAAQLVAMAMRFEASGRSLGCIGPVPIDRKQPAARTLAARMGTADDDGVVEVATIISSGMVIPAAAIAAVGGMWNELFIDQIDHEWCFRARAAGLAVVAATAVPMPHDMGDGGITLFGRYKPIHRSSARHFHIVRNTLWLARCSFIPRRWRMVETLKLAARVPAYLLFSSARRATLKAVLNGAVSGLRGPPARTLFAPSMRPIARCTY